MKVSVDNFESILNKVQSNLTNIHGTNDSQLDSKIQTLISKIEETKTSGATLLKDNNILKIGIVGQVKAGKSSFLNSLFFDGENILPRASTPMTAGLTVLEYAEENYFEVEYYNEKEWQLFEDRAKAYDLRISDLKSSDPSISNEEAESTIEEELKAAKELVKSCSRIAQSKIGKESKKDRVDFNNILELQNILETYVGADGKYTPIVKCLKLHLHDERLKGIQIVDTPGVNDPVVSREQRTREFLKSSHGVFFLSYSGRFFDSTDVNFLSNRIGAEGIGTVVLVASKFDSVLQDVGFDFKDDLIGACRHCEKTLKEQYYANMTNADYNGDDPEWTYSSGIGYSIAHKDEKRWDDIERHVVKQMKDFYPGAFSTIAEIKENFNALSNLEDIRNIYLEDTFIKNKEDIIQKKMKSFFEVHISKNLLNETDSLTQYIKNSLEILKSTDLASLKVQEKQYVQTIENIKNELKNIQKKAELELTKGITECLNNFGSNIITDNLPKVNVQIEWPRSSTFRNAFGLLSPFKIDTNTVDINKLISSQSKTIKNALSALYDEWNTAFGKFIDVLNHNIRDIFQKQEEADKTGNFNKRLLDLILDETILDISSINELKLYPILSKFSDSLNNSLIGKTDIIAKEPADTENDARDKNRKAQEAIDGKIKTILNNLRDGLCKDIDKELGNIKKECTTIFNSNTAKLTETFNDNLQKQLKQIIEDLQKKESKINLYNQILSTLNETRKELA